MIAFLWPETWLREEVLKKAFVNGLALGAVYGFVALALVLTYRVSRTVGFVHGGIAFASALVYWWLTADPSRTSGANTKGWEYHTRQWPTTPALFIALGVGGLLGALFGAVSSGRMATWPRITVTTFSLGGMLLVAGVADSIWPGAQEIVRSPFGTSRTRVWGWNLSSNEVAAIVLLPIVVLILHLVVTKTRAGIAVRSVSDDIEAAEMVGLPVKGVSLGVWVVSGVIAAFSGVLLTSTTRVAASFVLFALLRSMAGAAVGGFESLPLALVGAFMFGQVESHGKGGSFGTVSTGAQEVILMGLLFVSIMLVAWYRVRRARVRTV